MSKIGEYIHYKLSNYHKFGLGTDTSKDIITYSDLKSSMISKYLSMTQSSVNTITLEQDLNMLLKANQKASSQHVDGAVDSALATFYQQFADDVQNNFPGIVLDDNLKVINTASNLGKNGRAQSGKIQVNWTRLKQNIQFLAITLEKTSNLDPGLKQNIEQAKQLYKSLKLEMKAIGQDLNTKSGNSQHFKNMNDKMQSILKTLIEGDKSTGYPPLNDLISAAKTLSKVIEAQGYSTEKFLTLALDGAKNFPANAGFSEIQKFINSMHTGKNTSLQAISGDLVSTIGFTKEKYTKTIVDGQILYKMNSTGLEQQQKVDVSAEYTGPNGAKEFAGLNIKSINPYKSGNKTLIKLHSGSSLIQLLQEESDFLNHYLNIVPTRDKGNTRDSSFPSWHSLMKIAIVARSLTGSSIRLDKSNNFDPIANIFVIHNNASGNFRVFNIGQLIQNISMNIDQVADIQFSGINPFYGLKNTWVEATNGASGQQAARARINNLLGQLHNIKFTSYLNAQAMLGL